MSDSELCLQEIGKRIMDRRKKLGLGSLTLVF